MQHSYVYAGAAHWTSERDAKHQGGMLRKAVEDDRWHILNNGLPEGAEVRAIAVHPDDTQVVYAGTQHGPYRTTDGGDTWERLALPDPGMVVWSILFHPGNPEILYVGTSPAAVYRSEDGGDNWKRLTLAESAGAVHMGFAMRVIRMTADPGTPDDIYAGLEVGGVLRSQDGGDSWSDCSGDLLRLAQLDRLKSRIGSDTETEGMMDSHALCVSPAQSGTVFLATRMGLFRSSDRGNTWVDMEIGRFSPLTYARDVQVSPHNPQRFYACLSKAARSDAGSLYRSEDMGQTWQRFDHDVSPHSTMMTVSASRQDANRVYCATRGGQVFGTHDGGSTWQEYPLPAGLQDVYAVICV